MYFWIFLHVAAAIHNFTTVVGTNVDAWGKKFSDGMQEIKMDFQLKFHKILEIIKEKDTRSISLAHERLDHIEAQLVTIYFAKCYATHFIYYSQFQALNQPRASMAHQPQNNEQISLAQEENFGSQNLVQQNAVSSRDIVPFSQPPSQEVCLSCGKEGHMFSMEKNLDNVMTMWQEYAHGIHGKLSIQQRNNMGLNWRKEAKVNKCFYNNSKVIWSAVEIIAQELTVSQDFAAHLLDQKRAMNGWSIRSLRGWLQNTKKEANGSYHTVLGNSMMKE